MADAARLKRELSGLIHVLPPMPGICEPAMDQDSIINYVSEHFAGVDIARPTGCDAPEISWGDTFFIYDPNLNPEAERTFPFATIVTKDYGDFDCASNLNRDGVFRLNIGVGKQTYRSLFGPPPKPTTAGDVVTGYDFSALNQLMPHPVYAPQSWVCVLNPSRELFESVRPLLCDAYNQAVRRYAR